MQKPFPSDAAPLETEPAKTAWAMDRFMSEPARFVAKTLTAQGVRTYLYRFSYVAESMRSEWRGALHATEIPYVFDTVTWPVYDVGTDAIMDFTNNGPRGGPDPWKLRMDLTEAAVRTHSP